MRRFRLAIMLCAVAAVAAAGWFANNSEAQNPNQTRSSRSAGQRRTNPYGRSSAGSRSSRFEEFRRSLQSRNSVSGTSAGVSSQYAALNAAETQNSRQVHAEILFVEIAAADASKSKLPKLTGKTADVEKALAVLKTSGHLKSLERTKMSVLDGRKATTQIGEMKSVVSGTMFAGGRAGGRFGGAGGAVSRSYSMRSYGNLLTLTPAVEPAGSVVLDMQLEKTGPQGEDDSPKEAGETVAPPGSRTLSFRNTLRVPAGEFVLVTSSSYQTKKGTTRIVVLATAQAEQKPTVPKH